MNILKCSLAVFLAVVIALSAFLTVAFAETPNIIPLPDVSDNMDDGEYNGIDLTKNSTTYDPKIWDSEVTYNESVAILSGKTTVKLLYPIKQVVSVRSFDLQTVYSEGTDYTVTSGGELQILDGSKISVCQNVNDIYNKKSDGSTNLDSINAWESTLWKYQIMVTYTHDSTWGLNAAYESTPKGQLATLDKFVEKAKSGEQTNVVFYGDSITVGMGATGLNESSWRWVAGTLAKDLQVITATKAYTFGLDANNLPNWVTESWPNAVTNALKQKFGDNITYTNRAIGSTSSTFGSVTENMEFLLGSGDTLTPCPVPDLLFIGYGMNEATNSKETQNANTRKIINFARQLNPDCSIVLVSAFYPNRYDANYNLTSIKLGEQEQGYYELAEEYDNLIVAPVYSITESMLTVKNPIDYTHNGFNHPNDFGVKVYAATILAVLGDCAEHTYNILKYNEQQHWMECSCGQKDPDNVYGHTLRLLMREQDHALECICGYVDESSIASHSYENYFHLDNNYHCKECVCGAKLADDPIKHRYDNCLDTSCNDCGAIRAVSHVYGANYVSAKATFTSDGVISKKCTAGCNGVVKVGTISRIKTVTIASSVTYTGKTLKPKVTVKDAAGKPIASTNYTVTYSKNKSVGKATAKVVFKNNYSGTKTLTFKIVPKKTSISSLKAGKKSFTVKYSKQTSGTGYEIQYSTSSKFKSAKTVKISKNKTVSKTVKKLKSKKTYYVRVRVTKGSSYKSSWSSVKKVKVK